MDVLSYAEVKKWLRGKSRGTARNYITALTLYIEFTGMNPEEIIDEAEEDRKKPRRQRGKPEERIEDFHEYLLNKHTRARGKKAGGRGVSKNLAKMYFSAIRGFYKANGFPLNVRTPRASNKKENFKLNLRPRDVKRMLDFTRSLRDRSIILTMFQSGMDVSTLCSLNYGDVARELEEGREPLMLHIVREKEEVEYHTFLGRDAVKALKNYLAERKRRNHEELRYDTPLYVKTAWEKGKKNSARIERLTPNLIQKFFREVCLTSGVVAEDQLRVADINPARPHALRKAFNDILGLEGVNQQLIDYWMGHSIPYNGAYGIPLPDEQRKIYAEHEKALSVSGVISGVNEIEERFKREVERQNYIIQGLENRIAEIERADREVTAKLIANMIESNPEIIAGAIEKLGLGRKIEELR
jgi:integrase/recombinase XerD